MLHPLGRREHLLPSGPDQVLLTKYRATQHPFLINRTIIYPVSQAKIQLIQYHQKIEVRPSWKALGCSTAYTTSLNTDTCGMKEEQAASSFILPLKAYLVSKAGGQQKYIKLVPHYRETNPVTSRLGKEIKVREKGDLIPPICLFPPPTSYVFGEASHTGYDPLTTAIQP